MPELNPDFVNIVSALTNASPYFQLLSMELIEFDIGRSRIEIPVDRKHLQPFGNVHGGVFCSIIDAAAFWACYAEVEEDVGMTSVDVKLNYLAPSAGGKLIAIGRRIKLGKTLGLAEAQVVDEDGKVLAHGTSTLMVMAGLSFNREVGLPPKFRAS
jgi:uncharacterized protein (TIGR00369 family)